MIPPPALIPSSKLSFQGTDTSPFLYGMTLLPPSKDFPTCLATLSRCPCPPPFANCYLFLSGRSWPASFCSYYFLILIRPLGESLTALRRVDGRPLTPELIPRVSLRFFTVNPNPLFWLLASFRTPVLLFFQRKQMVLD